jgi:hypothetical protein
MGAFRGARVCTVPTSTLPQLDSTLAFAVVTRQSLCETEVTQ